MNRVIFAFAGKPARPRRFFHRFLLYLALCVAAYVFPPFGALGALAALFLLNLESRIDWLAWFRRMVWLWLILISIPILNAIFDPPSYGNESWFRLLSVFTLLALSQWLSQCTTIFEIRGALDCLFRPLGKRISARLSLLGSLSLAFIPWILEEANFVNEASALRGLDAKRHPLRALLNLATPLLLRLFEKARHTAEALELRSDEGDRRK